MAATLTDEQVRWISELTGVEASAILGPPAANTDPAAPLREVGAIWAGVESHIQSEIGKLQAALKRFFGGDPAEASMEKEFEAHVETIFQTFDTALAKDIAAATSAKTPDALAPIKAALRQAIEQCRSAIAADATIALFDDNPYVPLSLQADCDAALQRMAKTLT